VVVASAGCSGRACAVTCDASCYAGANCPADCCSDQGSDEGPHSGANQGTCELSESLGTLVASVLSRCQTASRLVCWMRDRACRLYSSPQLLKAGTNTLTDSVVHAMQTPTAAPTAKPTAAPMSAPTTDPTAAPTNAPTASPTASPTTAPTPVVGSTETPKPTPTPRPTPPPPHVLALERCHRSVGGNHAPDGRAAQEEAPGVKSSHPHLPHASDQEAQEEDHQAPHQEAHDAVWVSSRAVNKQRRPGSPQPPRESPQPPRQSGRRSSRPRCGRSRTLEEIQGAAAATSCGGDNWQPATGQLCAQRTCHQHRRNTSRSIVGSFVSSWTAAKSSQRQSTLVDLNSSFL